MLSVCQCLQMFFARYSLKPVLTWLSLSSPAKYRAHLVLASAFSVVGYEVFFGIKRQFAEMIRKHRVCSSAMTEQQHKRDDCKDKRTFLSALFTLICFQDLLPQCTQKEKQTKFCSFLMVDRKKWQHLLYKHNFTQNILDLVYMNFGNNYIYE